MKTITVASQNPVKIDAAQRGFERMFPGAAFNVKTVSVPSGVSDQPMSSQETLRGALNRTCAAAHLQPEADYWVGIEGGLEEINGELEAFAWVVVQHGGRTAKSRTGTFVLPPAVAALVREGKELGEADDIVFQRSNSKQANGAIGLLTADALNRTEYYEQAVILALVVFRNPELYPAG